jgi:dimethylglycine dehydrogenase
MVTEKGTVEADFVVNAAGLWGREVAAMAGVKLPLMPVEHHYLVTETVPEIEAMDGELPQITDAAINGYARQEGQGLLLGAYESPCLHWAAEGTPLDFGHELLPDDLDRLEWNLAKAIEVMPCLGEAGVKRVINGPMIFSPDLGPLLGPHPDLRNYYCANGVMTGFNQSAGIGKVMAEWIIEGEPSIDIFCWDVARFGPWASKAYTRARTAYFYEHRSDRQYPYEEHDAGRPVKTTAVHDRLVEANAVFGESYGLEHPLWFAPKGTPARDTLTYRRPNWFGPVADECRIVRGSVGLFEFSSLGKIEVRGPGAEAWLNRVLANRAPRTVGRTVLSPMLSDKGRLIGDFTLTRLGEERFLLLGADVMQLAYLRHFRRYLPAEGVALSNLSEDLAGLHIAGPAAQDLLAEVAEGEVGTQAFPFMSARIMDVGQVHDVIALRISFTGDLGYELYCPPAYQRTLFDLLVAAGAPLDLGLVGTRALMMTRLEKGFPAWGLELSPDYTPFEAGLDRFVRLDKDDFVGRAAVLRQQQEGPREVRATFTVDADDADVWGDEPVFRDGEWVGYVSSGGYGAHVEQSIALGYIAPEAMEPGAAYAIEILGDLRPAILHTAPLFDPQGGRMRG